MNHTLYQTFIAAVTLLVAAMPLAAQTEKSTVAPLRNNIVYAELGGVSAYYSLNYQRNFYFNHNMGFAAGVVISPTYALFATARGKERFSPRAGFQAQAIYRAKRHEYGIGAAINWYSWYRNVLNNEGSHYQPVASFISAQLGYSYTAKSGIYMGAYFTPMLTDRGRFDFMPWGGLHIGYRF